MTKDKELKNSAKYLSVDGKGLNKTNLEWPKEVIQGVTTTKQEGDPRDDFYARLKNMYNKPQVSVTRSNQRTLLSSQSDEKTGPLNTSKDLSEIVRKRSSLTSDAKKFLKNMQSDKTEKNKLPKAMEKIKYKWNQSDDVECRSAHYTDPVPEKNRIQEFTCKIEDIDKEFSKMDSSKDDFPTLEDLPKDHEELEKVFFKYVDRLTELANSMQAQHPNPEPGTEESVLSYKYKLDPPKVGKDPTEAVTGVRRCTCPETIEIDGDIAQLKDFKLSVKELKTNHKVGAIVVSVSKKDQIVDNSVDSSSKLKEMKGPILMTKYALEFLSSKISKHPCLRSITFKNVPLSSAVQALLIPAFANLKTLKLISAKLKDDGIKKLCQYLWRAKSLRVVDFTDNGVTKVGAEKVAKLIEKKGICRTLEPNSSPLERVTLNKNPIGTEGMKFILRALQIDFFMKAVDLRDCDIVSNSDEILDIIVQNLDLQILDLRGNNIRRLDLVIKNILQNRSKEDTIYKWEDEEEIQKYM